MSTHKPSVRAESPEEPGAIYEPPVLVEVGSFAEVTRGAEDGPSDFPYFSRGYWLI